MRHGRSLTGKPTGLTVVELAVSVVILGVFAGIAMPGIIGGIQRSGVDGAAKRLTEDIRLAQSNAITRGMQVRVVVFNQSGVAPEPANLTDATKANMYRLEMRSGPSAAWPALTENPSTNANVLTVWHDLGTQYRGVTVTGGNALLFNSQGFLLNGTSPVSVVLQGLGGSKTVQTSAIGKATIL